jgi:hypothetical protein
VEKILGGEIMNKNGKFYVGSRGFYEACLIQGLRLERAAQYQQIPVSRIYETYPDLVVREAKA